MISVYLVRLNPEGVYDVVDGELVGMGKVKMQVRIATEPTEDNPLPDSVVIDRPKEDVFTHEIHAVNRAIEENNRATAKYEAAQKRLRSRMQLLMRRK